MPQSIFALAIESHRTSNKRRELEAATAAEKAEQNRIAKLQVATNYVANQVRLWAKMETLDPFQITALEVDERPNEGINTYNFNLDCIKWMMIVKDGELRISILTDQGYKHVANLDELGEVLEGEQWKHERWDRRIDG